VLKFFRKIKWVVNHIQTQKNPFLFPFNLKLIDQSDQMIKDSFFSVKKFPHLNSLNLRLLKFQLIDSVSEIGTKGFK